MCIQKKILYAKKKIPVCVCFYVKVLLLRQDRLHQLPPELSSLPKLEYLDIRSNRLTSVDALASLSSLHHLFLQENDMINPPGEIFFENLSQLQSLNLGSNLLSKFHPFQSWNLVVSVGVRENVMNINLTCFFFFLFFFFASR